MRTFLAALIILLALMGSAFAGNVALASLGATAACGNATDSSPCYWTSGVTGNAYVPGNVIDGISSTKWIAPPDSVDPYVLITLNQPYLIDSVTISGAVSGTNQISWEVFVGGVGSTVSSLEAGTPIGTENVTGPTWSYTLPVSTSSPVEYILYEVTTSYGNPSGDTAGYDYAYANDIGADAVPEPGTFSLIGGVGMLALGVFRRRFQV